MDMPGAIGMCERLQADCVAHIDTFPWGGLPPPCVQRPQAYCATYTAGSASAPQWLCRRDPAGCVEAIDQVRAQHPPPSVVSASACAVSN